MKLSKFAISGILGLALAGTASAQSTIRIIGATTYRAPVHAAIEAILNSGYAFADSGASNSASALGGASAAEFTGTLKSNSNPVVIKTYWTGSVAGVSDLASQRAISGFMADGLAVVGGTGLGSGYAQEPSPEPCDMAMSDAPYGDDALCLQLGNTAAKAAKSTIQSTTFHEAGSMDQSFATGEGIVPFEWVLEKTTGAAPISNITQQTAQTLIENGYTSLMTLTGNTSNQYDYLFLIGRNEDSGSRCNAYAEAQTGFGQAAIQWMPSYIGTSGSYQDIGASPSYVSSSGTNYVYDGGTTATLSGLQKWPSNWKINTNTTIAWTVSGHSGFVSGGEVASALSAVDPVTSGSISITSSPTTPNNVYVIGYVGSSDANTAIGNGATELTYNGVLFSQNAVRNGQYTFWGYEQALYQPSRERRQAPGH